VICPAGQSAPVRTEPSGQRRASFAKAACRACPLRDRCVTARGSRSTLIAPDEELLVAARQALNDPATAEHLRRTRPRIERLLGLLAIRYGARKSRYFAIRKGRLQAAWAPRWSTSTRSVATSPPRPPDRRPERAPPTSEPADHNPRPPHTAPQHARRPTLSSGAF
jgi:hypothetical protein